VIELVTASFRVCDPVKHYFDLGLSGVGAAFIELWCWLVQSAVNVQICLWYLSEFGSKKSEQSNQTVNVHRALPTLDHQNEEYLGRDHQHQRLILAARHSLPSEMSAVKMLLNNLATYTFEQRSSNLDSTPMISIARSIWSLNSSVAIQNNVSRRN